MKQINYKDYYSVLGINRNSSDEEIKYAFRILVRKYHPDINSNKFDETRVKEIIEAYEILSDKEKRKNYNNMIDSLNSKGISSFKEAKKGKAISFNEIISNLIGNVKEGTINTIKKINNIDKDIFIDIFEAYNGINKNIIITNEKNCKKCDLTGKYLNNICDECQGKGVLFIKNTINLEIPPNTLSKSKIEIKGYGNGSGSLRGDLILNINVEEHKFFNIDNEGNINTSLPITVTEAILGAEIEVPTLKNSIKMKIPSGTQNETVFRLKDKGFYDKTKKEYKHQYVKISILIPKNISNKEKELYNELALMEKIYPRDEIYEVAYGKNK